MLWDQYIGNLVKCVIWNSSKARYSYSQAIQFSPSEELVSNWSVTLNPFAKVITQYNYRVTCKVFLIKRKLWSAVSVKCSWHLLGFIRLLKPCSAQRNMRTWDLIVRMYQDYYSLLTRDNLSLAFFTFFAWLGRRPKNISASLLVIV